MTDGSAIYRDILAGEHLIAGDQLWTTTDDSTLQWFSIPDQMIGATVTTAGQFRRPVANVQKSFIDALNSYMKADSEAMNEFLSVRVLCNEDLTNTGCGFVPVPADKPGRLPRISFLSILNGLLLGAGVHPVFAVVDEETDQYMEFKAGGWTPYDDVDGAIRCDEDNGY